MKKVIYRKQQVLDKHLRPDAAPEDNPALHLNGVL